MLQRECKWTAAVLWSACLAASLALQLSAVRGESSSEPLDTTASADSTTETPSGTTPGGTTETSVATTVGFVVILLILVLAVLITVLLCVRQGLCACPSKKPPAGQTPASPAAAREPISSRANRSPLVSSSSVRSSNQRGGHSTHSPNTVFHLPHSHHHHHSHHSHHHHSHSHTSPRRHSNNNGYVVGPPVDRTMNSNNSGTSVGDSSGYSQHHNMRSASMDPPLPNNISPYPGMPFPYQPCKSAVTAYGGGGMGYTIHPQIPRTPTSASITTLSTLSTTHNQRHTTSNGTVVVEGRRERGGSERGERAVAIHVVCGDRSHAGGRERGGSERGVAGGGREVREWRVGGGDVEEERSGVSDGAGRGGGGRGDEERGGRGRADGGEREANRSGGRDTAQVQRSPVTQRQVELGDSINNNSPPLQLYSTQV